jgi:hypothetical protein
MAEMKQIKAEAKKRRAKLLAEFNRKDLTVTKFAERHGVTRARMSQLLLQARAENVPL